MTAARIFLVLLGKEWKESFRRRRAPILVLVFALFAILSPILARYMPDILAALMAGQAPGSGPVITMPEPTVRDSFDQLAKNLTQNCIFLLLLLSVGTVVEEKTRGYAVLVLTRGVPRSVFLLAKYAALLLVVLLCLVAAFGLFAYYNYLLFDTWPDDHLLQGCAAVFLHSAFLLAATILASTLARSVPAAAAGTVGGYLVLSAMSMLPILRDGSPLAWPSVLTSIFLGQRHLADFPWMLLTSVVGTLAFLGIAIRLFQRQEL